MKHLHCDPVFSHIAEPYKSQNQLEDTFQSFALEEWKGPTFDEVRVQHLGLFKLEDGVLGVACSEVDVCQAHQEVHVVSQQRLLLQRAGTHRRMVTGGRALQWSLAEHGCPAHHMVLMAR